MNFDYYNHKYIRRMEYQKIKNLLDKTNDQPSKFRTREWVEVCDDSNRIYQTSKQIKLYISMLKLSLCDFSNKYILVKISITITVAGAGAGARHGDERNKQVTFKNCTPCTNCIRALIKTQVDNARCLDIVIPMCNLVEYSNN